MDPIHQFQIKNLLTFGHIGGAEIAFTNSALFMFIALALITALTIGATSPRALIPGRMQSIAEMSYEFIADTLHSTAGSEGMKFFPLVFSLFMFILAVNMIGLIPYMFTVTSSPLSSSTASGKTGCISSSCSHRAESRST
jgi:F-type H+-transporting ATPase subunit a